MDEADMTVRRERRGGLTGTNRPRRDIALAGRVLEGRWDCHCQYRESEGAIKLRNPTQKQVYPQKSGNLLKKKVYGDSDSYTNNAINRTVAIPSQPSA